MKLASGREGDWKCSVCGNRNYAFRSLCNRCKQPRLLVDHETPSDSKWLPRIGDWICTGCSNNNYASREKCNKCGKPKESAALPAASLSGAAITFPVTSFLPSIYPGNISANIGMALSMPASISRTANFPFSSSDMAGSTIAIPAGNWRPNDWLCSCGFVNYASRSVCKKCSAPSPALLTTISQTVPDLQYPGCGIKRQASDDVGGEWSGKRQHTGETLHPSNANQLTNHAYPLNGGFENDGSLALAGQLASSTPNSVPSGFNPVPSGFSSIQGSLQSNPVPSGFSSVPSGFSVDHLTASVSIPGAQNVVLQPTLLGKGAKQWRVGDWMCSGCENHNFASRQLCNRCGRIREAPSSAVQVS